MICANIFTYFIISEALFHSSFQNERYWALIPNIYATFPCWSYVIIH